MSTKIGKLIVVRHGESEWNKANIFTGKTDVHLSPDGFKVSEALGALIKDIEIHKVYTSTQARSIETEVCMMSGGGHCDAETIHYNSALNERDYGDYTGKNKDEIKKELGEEGVQALRRAWDYHVPNGETLKMVYERAVPFFRQEILPLLRSGENVLVVSHGNTIRALLKYIEKIGDNEIEKMEMPFNEVFIYELDADGYMLNKETRNLKEEGNSAQEGRVRSSVQIIATIGPVSSKYEVVNEMVKAGMDMARLNFSWPSREESMERIRVIREAEKTNNRKILILGDLPGPRVQGQKEHTSKLPSLVSIRPS